MKEDIKNLALDSVRCEMPLRHLRGDNETLKSESEYRGNVMAKDKYFGVIRIDITFKVMYLCVILYRVC